MAKTTPKPAVLHNLRSPRMMARRSHSRLLIAVVAAGIAAVAIFTSRTVASDSAEKAVAVASEASRFESLSSMVAEQDAAARRAIQSARRLTGTADDADDQNAAPAAEVASGKVPAVSGELLRSAKSSATSSESASTASKKRIIRMLVTAYCPCTKCCGPNAQGITASGKLVSYNQGRFVAADKKVLPFGTKLKIAGYHNAIPVEVTDTGSAIKGNRLDVYYPSHQRALEWGKRWVDVVVLE